MILCSSVSSRLLTRKGLNYVKKVSHRLLNISCQVEQLKTRALIRVSGDDASNLLQGIITNDIRHLQDHSKCLFTMFLNTKGRVLYDSIVYKPDSKESFLIECDHNGCQDLVKHLKMYKLRKKVQVDDVSDEWKLWVLFNPKMVDNLAEEKIIIKQEQIVPCSAPITENGKEHNYFEDIVLGDNIITNTDPRLASLGSRVIAPANEDILQRVKNKGIEVESSTSCTYRTFRYRLGVGEGIEELPIGKCFPLEANCDYLHGVSFHKGCYIGQELTARTHHTGVVRKRIMPLIFNQELGVELPIDTPIEDATGQKKNSIGKLRGIENNSGIGLLRIADALEVVKLRVKDKEGETLRPSWWPQELSKERIDSGRSKSS